MFPMFQKYLKPNLKKKELNNLQEQPKEENEMMMMLTTKTNYMTKSPVCRL